MQNDDCAPRVTTFELWEEFALDRNISLLTAAELKLLVKNHSGLDYLTS